MKKNLFSKFLVFVFCLVTTFSSKAQNLGFEATPVTSPPTNWTAVTGTWTVNTSTVRTGTQSMTITDPATTGTTIGTTNPFLTTTGTGNYLITMGWGRSTSATNALFYLGYRSGTTNTLNPTTTTSGQPANINNTAWSRVVSVSAATVGAGSYGVSLRAFTSASVTGTQLFIDDIIMYSSTSNVPDVSAPNAPTNVLVAGANLAWVNGTDNGSPASGIGGMVILRAPGTITMAPTLNDQAMYAATSGEAGSSSFTQSGVTWTVVGNINDGSQTTFSDPSSTSGTFTYVVFLRDLAYNYSTGIIATTANSCTGIPTAGTSVVSPSAVQCFSIARTLSLAGATFASGISYQWQTATSFAGTYTNFSSALSSSSLTINPNTTAFYRCKVKCGTDSVYSTPVEVLVNSGLAGNFTINKNIAASSTNFVSFADAVAAISCGITGPVTFTVAQGTGPYTEQITIPPINGVSSTNRITIKGNNETLTFSPTVATSRHVLWLNGADHLVIDSLNIVAGGTVAGWGVVLTNQADSNSIRNCTIDVGNLTSTSTNFMGVVINGSSNTTAISGNNGNGNIIENNTITSGSSGFYLYGSSTSTTQNAGNIFRNNIVRDFYGYGVVALYASEGTIISKNDFSRPTRTTSTTTGGVSLSTGCRGVLVEKNRVHNLFDAFLTSTSAAYGVLVGADAVVGVENKIINNAFYNYNGNGTHYGISNSGADYMQAYHNTIIMDNASATGIAYGLHQTTAAIGVIFKNNIVSITKGGTAAKRAMAFITTTSTIISNNNVFYFNPSAGTDNHLGQFGASTATFSDLNSWKTANTNAYDQLSLSLDPAFVDPNNGNLAFTNQTIDGKGENLNITRDILDSLRGATPDPGCYELSFLVSGIDMVADALINPANNLNGCYTNAESVTVRIKNNSSSTINFATNPCTITVALTGTATQNINHIVNTGTLASNATLEVALPSTLNLSAIGGYSINATTAVVGDINAGNNSLSTPVTREKVGLSAGTVSVLPSSYCAVGGNLPILRSTAPSGHNSLKWQSSTTSNGTFTDIIGATTNPFTTTAPLTQTMYYRAVATCGTQTNNSVEDTVDYINPQITSTTPATACGVGTVNLSATSTPGTTINWYAAASGGTALGTGTNFSTPSINATTTYFVAAVLGSPTINMPSPTIGTSTFITTSAGWGLRFTANNTATISTVQISASNATAGNATIQINVTDLNDVLVYSGTVHNFTIGTSLATYTIPVNITVAQGNYKMVMTYSGINNMVRESSGVTFPYTSPNNEISITAGANGTGTLQTTSAYYWFYNWVLGGGCEGTRTPVVATITSAPSISSSTTRSVICNGSSTTLNVTSTNTNYAYTWSPLSLTGSSVNASPTATTKYYVNALDGTTGCRALDSVTINVQPTITGATASPASFCITGGAATLSIAPASGYAANSLQWQTSTNNITFNNIAGANATTYTTPTITATTFYKIQAKDGAGNVCNAQDVVVQFNNPQILNTVPRYTCGTGSVKLDATATPGATINWYAAASGGSPLASGTRFNTPSISTTTTYFVSAATGSSNQNTGKQIYTANPSSGAGTTNFGLVFDALTGFTLKSVVIYPVSSTSASGSVTVDVINSAGTVIATGTYNVTGSPTTAPVAQLLNLNFDIPAGTNYKLRPGSYTGISGILFDPSANAPAGNYGYPYVVPGILSINTSTLTAAPTNTARNDLYYYFYDWVISTGCESARTPVIATVDNSPGCMPLPVSLVNFTGKKEGSVNLLNWNTANEINNKGFYVQRSADGSNFSNLLFVNSKALDNGNSSNGLNYTYTDNKPLAGNNYYRLVQQDKDGKTSLSNIVLIKGIKTDKVELQSVYPNPFGSILNTIINAPANTEVKLIITDIAGRIVQQNVISVKEGSNNISLNTSSLGVGTYFLQAKCLNGCSTSIQKIVKQ